jgi:hypothetical protein
MYIHIVSQFAVKPLCTIPNVDINKTDMNLTIRIQHNTVEYLT